VLCSPRAGCHRRGQGQQQRAQQPAGYHVADPVETDQHAGYAYRRRHRDPAGQQHPPVTSPCPGAASKAEQQSAAEHHVRGVTTRERHPAGVQRDDRRVRSQPADPALERLSDDAERRQRCSSGRHTRSRRPTPAAAAGTSGTVTAR